MYSVGTVNSFHDMNGHYWIKQRRKF